MTTQSTISHRGRVLTVLGEKLNPGDALPEAVLRAGDQSPVALSSFTGNVMLISVVPSLDTGICDAQTRRFNEEAARYGDDVVVLTVSAEHPFNQKRWCGAAGIDRVIVLSDHYDMAFGNAFGTHILDYRLEQRAIFVADPAGTLTYVEYVPEIAQHPDYDAALAAVASLVG